MEINPLRTIPGFSQAPVTSENREWLNSKQDESNQFRNPLSDPPIIQFANF